MNKKKLSPTASEIKEARTKAGQTQAKAAEFMQVSLRTWSYWESGKFGMPIDTWHMYKIKTGQTSSAVVIAINNVHNAVAKFPEFP
jgi:DNA-binding XRE family transcriptional regulator